MFVHQSNRLEILLHQLRATLQAPQTDPLLPAIIVVQHQGMAQWVAQQLAFADGIAANLQFPLPARLVWTMFQALAETVPAEDLFRKPVLRWRLAVALLSRLNRPEFREIATYLHDDADGAKLYQLTGRISDVFDQYLVYRPELLDRWQQGKDRHWQACLWRKLTDGATPHRACLGTQFRQLLDSVSGIDGKLAPRYHLFGLNSLAPVYLDIFAHLGRLTEVHLYHLSPCRQYWGDLVSARQQASMRARTQRAAAIDAYNDQGHPLLISLGKIGQDFFRQLLELEVLQETDLYQEDRHNHLLASLHNDILDLYDRSASEETRFPLDPADRSVQFHCCSSPLREIQVLHDRLLDCLQQYPNLTPGDILVCAPDIQLYADAVAGVFGEAGQERRIPWSIADQPLADEHPLVRCFLDLLDLFTSRFTAPEVLALCETPALLRRFGLDPAALPLLHSWVRESGIRWGLDEPHRQELDVQAGMLHCWRFGLDRLVLGYLMGTCREPQAGILPYEALASSDADDLGGFVTLLDTLANWRHLLGHPRPAAAWSEDLLGLLDSVFAPSEEDEQGLQSLREAVGLLQTDCRSAGHHKPLSFVVVKEHLKTALSQPSGGQAFLSGRVTFCNMVPMRSVPFRVICLLGMNDQSFPRSQHPPAFDLMASEPRLGDRNRRQDDRYLFLEALLSAREVFYLSWVGRNLRDDSLAPPSAVISELQEYLDHSCFLPEKTPKVAAHLTTIHPMQPFSRRCFEGIATTASYNPAWLPAVREEAAPSFLATSLPEPAEEWRSVSLRRLIQFWQHPGRFLLEQILGMRLRDEAAGIEESEPFSLDALQGYHLRRETVTDMLTGMPLEQIGHGFASEGRLPHGSFGRNLFNRIVQESIPFATDLQPLLTQPLPPLEIDHVIGPYRLTGWLGDCYPTGRITWRTGTLKGRDLIALWLPHLALNLLAPESLLLLSLHIARDTTGADTQVHRVTLGPVPDPQEHLRWLLDHYWQGLSRPLPFFPETSLAWIKAVRDDKDPLQAARQSWEDGFQRTGEGSDLVCQLCFQQTTFIPSQEFVALTALYTPILDHLEADDATA